LYYHIVTINKPSIITILKINLDQLVAKLGEKMAVNVKASSPFQSKAKLPSLALGF
jgi:hypothetical protein